MEVTVVVCTHNRAELLRRTLECMRGLEVPAGVAWELLVVDNACTDGTPEVLACFADLPLRVVSEPALGKSNACNRAVAEARGRLTLWTDDDVLVPRGWLRAYRDAAAHWPRAAFFGGPIRPRFLDPPPRWLAQGLPQVREAYALLDHERVEHVLAYPHAPYGANMAFRAEALRGYRFDPKLGVTGRRLRLGEETALFRRMQGDGLRGVWVPDAPVEHLLGGDRLTTVYLARYFRGWGRSRVREIPNPARRAAYAGYALLRVLFDAGPAYAFRRLTRPAPVWLRTHRRLHSNLGKVVGLFID